MARVKLNPILEEIRGQVGDLVFKHVHDSTVISRKPNFEDVTPSDAQQAHRVRFRQAALYGKVVMSEPETKARYEEAAERVNKPVFSLMVADFLNAPSIEEVDVSAYSGTAGDPIVVTAWDDFEVAGVQVVISDMDGRTLESGDAVLGIDGRWVYTSSEEMDAGTTVRIGVTAGDRPGGTDEASAEKTV